MNAGASVREDRRRRALAAPAAVVILLSLVVVARQVTAEMRGDPPPPPFSVTVDEGAVPPLAQLPGLDGDTPRPVASIVAEDGTPAEFVENELILATDDESRLEAFLARWQGEVLAAFDPTGAGLDDLATLHLVRVDARGADTSALAADLRSLDADLGGAYRVSSRAALGLLTAGAQAAARGLPVGVNWVLRGGDFRGRVSDEAPEGPDGYVDRNAFTWPTHRTGAGQDIGVAEAWRALDHRGAFDNRVKIAILDSGFQPDADTPGGWLAVSNVPFRDAIGTSNVGFCAGACDWHGTNVVSAAMAVPDNDFGGAGPAGPVAEPILVNTLPDQFTLIGALGKAGSRGAKIANISGGVPVPLAFAWSVYPFEAATWAFRRAGLLIVAAAGNSGTDVDAGVCLLGGCVEWTWHTPCENRGVICVGGLDWDSTTRHPASNHGGRDVDIFAPYMQWVGPDPYLPEGSNRTQLVAGTSFAAPFLAGVAALVWAADPGLSADDVESILMETAHTSPDGTVGRYVNALAAVRAGSSAPEVVIVTPDEGAQVPLDTPVSFVAVAHDLEDGNYCCRLVWAVRSDAGTYVGVGRGDRTTRTFTTPGVHTLHVRATDSDGRSRWASITVEAVDTPPSVLITRPTPGESIPRGTPYLVRATAADPGEPDSRLDCDRLRWTSSVEADPLPQTGCRLEVTFPTSGPRTLTVTATDPRGATGTARVAVTVVEAPPGQQGPVVRITAPDDGDTIVELPRAATLDSEVVDPAGEGLAHAWSVTYPYDPVSGAGGTTEAISPLPLRPFGALWRPADTFDTETWCGLDGRPIRLELQVTDAAGRTASDHVVLHTYPCPVVD